MSEDRPWSCSWTLPHPASTCCFRAAVVASGLPMGALCQFLTPGSFVSTERPSDQGRQLRTLHLPSSVQVKTAPSFVAIPSESSSELANTAAL